MAWVWWLLTVLVAGLIAVVILAEVVLAWAIARQASKVKSEEKRKATRYND